MYSRRSEGLFAEYEVTQAEFNTKRLEFLQIIELSSLIYPKCTAGVVNFKGLDIGRTQMNHDKN